MSTTMEGRQYELHSYGAGQSFAIKAVGKPDAILVDDQNQATNFRRYPEACERELATMGWDSYNPELPPTERESNRDWVLRELFDLSDALTNLEHEIRKARRYPADGEQ